MGHSIPYLIGATDVTTPVITNRTNTKLNLEIIFHAKQLGVLKGNTCPIRKS